MDSKIYDPTVIIRDDNIVAVGASQFGDKDCVEKYYRILTRLAEDGKCTQLSAKTVLCQLRTFIILFLKKKFQKKTKKRLSMNSTYES